MHGIKLLSWRIAMLALCLAASAQARPGRHAPAAKPAKVIAVSEEERDMIEDIAYANLGEIALGKLAIGKTMSRSVKSFAQRMIDDHSRAQSALERLAKARGVSLPAETDMQHQTIAIGLRGLAGGAFDEQYLKRAGIDEHERFIDLLQQVGEEAQDRDLRVYADRTLRLVGLHLSMAGELDEADDGASAGDGKGGD
jgi:putative membrane protein